MAVIEEILRMSNSDCVDYIWYNSDILECELNGEEYKEPKKHNRNFCIECNLVMLID